MHKVLDPCCASKMMYFSRDDPRVLFSDVRSEDYLCYSKGRGNFVIHVKPDVLADFSAMPFEDESFFHVVFDPPHAFIRGNGTLQREYGTLCGIDWKDVLSKGFSECFRVLKKNGTLIFKWSEVDIPLKEILSLTPYKPIYGHRSGKRAQTHWCAFIKE